LNANDGLRDSTDGAMSEPKLVLGTNSEQTDEDLASYIALRLPENLPLRGDRNEASAVILRLIRQAEFPGSNPGREAEHVASGSTEAGGLKPPSAKIVGTQAELTTIEQDIDKLGATALRIADERNRYKADAEHLLAQWDILKAKHDALWEFLRGLSNAMTYRSHDLGYEDSISRAWKDDAADLLKETQ
jgi:hypothetical protein